jgi:xylulokinase
MSETKKYLGIDIGTTSIKAAVFAKDGKRLALRSVDYTLDTDPVTGFIEFNADEYVNMCKNIISELISECGKIDALSVDTQGETLILTDEQGTPLYPAVVWLDNRASNEAEEIKERFGNKCVYEFTGQPEITAGWPASKILWMKNNRPEIFKNVKKIFMLEDYIIYRLSGAFVTEPTIQSSTIYYDITRGEWWKEMLDFIGITEDMLPKVVKTATLVGEYSGIKVVSGMLDQIAGTLGAGVTDKSRISEMTGTIMAICVMTDKLPPFNAESIIPCHLHAIDGKYCLILWSSTAGMALKWFKNNFAESFSFRELDELAENVSAGCDGLTMLPYFCGSTMPKYNPEARAAFSGINLSHTRGHFARAIMEAIAFTLKQNLEYVGEDAIKEIRITGGGASSPLWANIKADVTGKVLKTLSESETACLGTALAAAVGIGDFESLKDAVDSIVKIKNTYAPTGVDYSDAYSNYNKLDKMLN